MYFIEQVEAKAKKTALLIAFPSKFIFFLIFFSLFVSFFAQVAKKYYGTDKLYVFNGLHNDPDGPTFEERDQDRPPMSTLFDTFVAVRRNKGRSGFGFGLRLLWLLVRF